MCLSLSQHCQFHEWGKNCEHWVWAATGPSVWALPQPLANHGKNHPGECNAAQAGSLQTAASSHWWATPHTGHWSVKFCHQNFKKARVASRCRRQAWVRWGRPGCAGRPQPGVSLDFHLWAHQGMQCDQHGVEQEEPGTNKTEHTVIDIAPHSYSPNNTTLEQNQTKIHNTCQQYVGICCSNNNTNTLVNKLNIFTSGHTIHNKISAHPDIPVL